ncbi:hypothetical protein DSUL_260018 [Desulfovibrionales bacterium]
MARCFLRRDILSDSFDADVAVVIVPTYQVMVLKECTRPR